MKKDEEMRKSRSVVFSCWSNFEAQKAHAAMSFLLFTLNFRKEMLVVKISINLPWIFHHFVCVAESDHNYHQK